MSKHRLRMYGAKQESLKKIIYLQSQSLIPETLYFCLHLIKKKNKETGDDKNVEQKWMENQRKADERLLARSNIKCQWNEQPWRNAIATPSGISIFHTVSFTARSNYSRRLARCGLNRTHACTRDARRWDKVGETGRQTANFTAKFMTCRGRVIIVRYGR